MVKLFNHWQVRKTMAIKYTFVLQQHSSSCALVRHIGFYNILLVIVIANEVQQSFDPAADGKIIMNN
jgi:hypothetical protein